MHCCILNLRSHAVHVCRSTTKPGTSLLALKFFMPSVDSKTSCPCDGADADADADADAEAGADADDLDLGIDAHHQVQLRGNICP